MDNPTCPKCDGLGAFLGTLGTLDWFRCVQCGWDWAAANEFSPEHAPQEHEPETDDDKGDRRQ